MEPNAGYAGFATGVGCPVNVPLTGTARYGLSGVFLTKGIVLWKWN